MIARLLAVLLALALTAPARGARADEGGRLDHCVTEVLARSPRLRAGALRTRAYRQEALAASTYPDPSLSGMVDRVPMGVEMPMIRYQVSQMFPWPGKLGLMRDAVERQGDAAGADLDARRLDLRLDAKRGWFMLLLNERRRQVNRAGRSLAATIAAAALGRYGAGMGDHHEVARAEVEAMALDVEHVDLEGERGSIVAMLNALRDRPIDTAIPDPDDAPPRPVTETLAALIQHALKQRPELQGMGAMREEAQAMARLARKETLPDLMGSLWLNQNIGAAPSLGAMVGGTIPLFGVGRQRHRAAAFDARAEGAAQDQAGMRAMIRFQVADAFTRVQTAGRQIALIKGVVLPKAKESFGASIGGYGAARVEIVGVLDARRALQATELALAEATIQREIAAAELERALGTPIERGRP